MSIHNQSFSWSFIKNAFYFHILSIISGFQASFYQMRNFTRIATLNTASDDVTNYVTYIIFNTDCSICSLNWWKI